MKLHLRPRTRRRLMSADWIDPVVFGRVANRPLRFRPPPPNWHRRFGPVAMPRVLSGRGAVRSVGGIPDDCEGVIVVLAGGATEIGVEPTRAEFGGGER